jgi:hypothetical protein
MKRSIYRQRQPAQPGECVFNLGLISVRLAGSELAGAFSNSVVVAEELGYWKSPPSLNNLATLALHQGDSSRAAALALEVSACAVKFKTSWALLCPGQPEAALDQGDPPHRYTRRGPV